jgi:hypothetical protein
VFVLFCDHPSTLSSQGAFVALLVPLESNQQGNVQGGHLQILDQQSGNY